LGITEAVSVPLGAGGRQLEVRLGNEAVVADGERCVRVVPCAVDDDPMP
jgi:hypothetical protein